MTIPRPLKIGIGGPVGSGKTALTEALCLRLRETLDRRTPSFSSAARPCRPSGWSAWKPAAARTRRSAKTHR